MEVKRIYPQFERVVIRKSSNNFPNLREILFFDYKGEIDLELVITKSELKTLKKALRGNLNG